MVYLIIEFTAFIIIIRVFAKAKFVSSRVQNPSRSRIKKAETDFGLFKIRLDPICCLKEVETKLARQNFVSQNSSRRNERWRSLESIEWPPENRERQIDANINFYLSIPQIILV
jgi:hypothetical protein